MTEVERRARSMLSDYRTLVWEADAGTLSFTYIDGRCVELLGYPREAWTTQPGFWTQSVLEEDRDDALANCALCTGRGRGHNFSFRIVASDGRILRFFNVVRAVRGSKGVAVRLRGILFEATDETGLADAFSPVNALPLRTSRRERQRWTWA